MLAGLSFGGRVVTQAALSAPDRMAGLMLLDSVLDGVPWDPGSAAASDTAVRQARDRGLLAGRAAWLAHPLFATACQHPRLAGQLAEMTAGYPGQHWTGHDPHKQAGPPPIDTLEKLAMPVLVLVAEHDVPCFKEMSAVLARRIPGARYHVVRGAGHMLNWSSPARSTSCWPASSHSSPRISDVTGDSGGRAGRAWPLQPPGDLPVAGQHLVAARGHRVRHYRGNQPTERRQR